MANATWKALALILTLLPVGCGFQLRGALDIPDAYSPVFIQSGGAVGAVLRERLQDSALEVAPAPGAARLILRVLAQQRHSRIVAVDRDGKALAYELTYMVRFDALGQDRRPLLPPQSLSAVRTFDDNPDVAVLGKQLESEIIYQDLVADVADRILLRLRAGLASKTTPAGTHAGAL
jgi:LPS-assembly lipoprotein